MIIVQLKNGHEFESPEENVPNIKRLFFGEIKGFKPVGETIEKGKVVIGSSKEDLKPKKKATN